MSRCLICNCAGIEVIGGNPHFDCPRCGNWRILPAKDGDSWTLSEELVHGGDEWLRRSNLSCKVRRMERPGYIVGIPLDEIGLWGLDEPLPTPMEQADELVLLLGERQPAPNAPVQMDDYYLAAWLGEPIEDTPGKTIRWLIRQPQVKDLVEFIMDPPAGLRLMFEGWARFQELRTQASKSRTAFMARQFNDETLDHVVETCFTPAVAAAGFELRTVLDNQAAGLIDDQIRVAIRSSAFVIADLTHGNRGAYWEAGFAEGLGKPVIYTCQQEVWDKEPTHFDTNHLVTVIWQSDNLGSAANRLKATVRATLPDSAILEDKPV